MKVKVFTVKRNDNYILVSEVFILHFSRYVVKIKSSLKVLLKRFEFILSVVTHYISTVSNYS